MSSRSRSSLNLPRKSIWDEGLLSEVLPQARHRYKIWTYLIQTLEQPRSVKGIIAETQEAVNKKIEQAQLKNIPFEKFNIPRKSAEIIKESFELFTCEPSFRFESSQGNTTKLLIKLQDKHEVETVIMRHSSHATVCVSSQIGCQMGCKFCATGTMGIIGNLTAGEILEQLVLANSITRIRNVVFMGMGEPLNNYENVKAAVEFMVDNKRFALSARQVTVSTVGVLKYMRKLSEDLPFLNLALSLHASNQTTRLQIVPAAKGHPYEKLLEAVDFHIEQNIKYYTGQLPSSPGYVENNKESNDKQNEDESNKDFINENNFNKIVKKGGRKLNKISSVMIEYILIKDVNDKPEHAHELGQLLSKRKDNILLNLIPYNPTDVTEEFYPPLQETVDNFFNICISEPYIIHTRVRQEKGQDIAGACGQLALVKQGEHFEIKKNTKDLEDCHEPSTQKKSSCSASCSSTNCCSSSASSPFEFSLSSFNPSKLIQKFDSPSKILSSLSILTYLSLVTYHIVKKK